MRTLSKEILEWEGKEVEMAGWVAGRRDHGKIIFVDLGDRSGITQLVFTPKDKDIYETGNTLRSEWVIRVKGLVQRRPSGMENNDLPTGKHEIQVTRVEVLAQSETPPFSLDTDGNDAGEEMRMQYRYLDIRRPRLTNNLRMRHLVQQYVREFLSARDFVEVETPILGKSTPEGARDYLVPSRLRPGAFYALPQSPQQYKQLLMVAGIERYFQIVRCFRDEDTRGDRQPEFTQLDIEMSFIEQQDILDLAEEMLIGLVRALYPDVILTLDKNGRMPRLTYREAMDTYKTDRPDLRKNTEDPKELAFGIIVDFPAFEWKEQEKRWDAVHHPFTMPQVSDVGEFNEQFEKDPGQIMAYQYDIVLNGYEIAGGSIRIHESELLTRIFEVMGNKRKDIEEKFGHLLKAFQYGVPPHGGIAFGFDRLMMVLQNEPSIREVIAFPKTGDGRDLMMGAPSEVDAEQLKELHIKVDKE